MRGFILRFLIASLSIIFFVAIQNQSLKAQNGSGIPEQVVKAAKQVTVVVRGGDTGSGVIVSRKGSTYYVLTANHVVDKPSSESVIVTTPKKEDCQVKKVKSLRPELDLAVLEFSSSEGYEPIRIGDSSKLEQGMPVTIAGFPEPGQKLFTDRIFSNRQGVINYLPSFPSKGGYGLGYDSLTPNGMSGGPVLDANKCLVAIHGRREGERSAGIPINLFSNLAPSLDIRLIPCSLSTSPSSPPSQSPPVPPTNPPKHSGGSTTSQARECTGCNLSGQNLQGANLQGFELTGANLQNANLQNANLQSAELTGANLQNANLQEANLQGAELVGANFQNANLRGANLHGADQTGANLNGADTTGVKW